MKALMQPLLEIPGLGDLAEELPKRQGVTFVAGCLESQKAHMAAGITSGRRVRLIVCENELKAKEFYEDYLLYDKEACLYPAKDMIFQQADIKGNLLTQQRLKIVQRLIERKPTSIITGAGGCMDYLLPVRVLENGIFTIANDASVDLDALIRKLTLLGYERTGVVAGPGEFSVRGGIIDIYVLTEEVPYRIELWGDEVDSLRSFDIESQRSIENLESVTIFPAAEYIPEAPDEDPAARNRRMTDTLFDYLPDDAAVILDEPGRILEAAGAVADEYMEFMKQRMEKEMVDPAGIENLLTAPQLAYEVNRRHALALSVMEVAGNDWEVAGRLYAETKSVASYNNQFPLLVKDIAGWKQRGYRMILLSPSATRASRLAGELLDAGLPAFYSEDETRTLEPGEVMVLRGSARRGFEYPLLKFVVVTESDIFGKSAKKKRKKREYSGRHIQDFSELSIGDYVVHESHGLGVYKGIEKVTVDRVVKDYIKIAYEGGSNLYIQPSQLDVLQKYAGADARKPKLNKLGTQEWNKTKSKVRGAVKDIAKDLVNLYAIRQDSEGYAYGPDTVWQREFEEMFPFDETEDQLAAIEATKEDMQSTKIMDRLVCGDVGYGKTEIALRAAFKAVQDSKQVVFLVPTTILAQQHYNTFTQRMRDFPVRVDLMCRFRTPAQQRKTIEDTRRGLVDIVIGTHRVLSKDLVFKNLGLLIVDEEQRFGVAHKEKIKNMKKNVDVLTLTATPIPRTLHMSLIGIRDMSILEEPPQDRIPIQTYVMEYNEEMVREAISREVAREGQVYYVYNRVNDIVEFTNRVAKLVPEANVGFAHGQMKERELERVMVDFINGEIDVLVTTTIIETGLDISNVNTMIIHDADKMGLSQLYQLRGRVGRSTRTSFAFLLYKRDKMLKEIAEKRLKAIREFTDLGSGFKIAMRDLELRGAGNLLGAEQHGHMEAVGYDLYCKMLSEAVREAKGMEPEEDFETLVDIDVDAYIPPEYITNEALKLDIYKRIAAIETDEEYEDMIEELMDRFGEPKKPVVNLLMVAKLKSMAHAVDITEMKQTGETVRISFYERARLDPNGFAKMHEIYGNRFVFRPAKCAYATFMPSSGGRRDKISYLEQCAALVEDLKKYCYRAGNTV